MMDRLRLQTYRQRILPSFLIIGAQKCGTTSLFNYLLSHPAILRAWVKEIHYFDVHYKNGFPWYQAHFPLSLHLRKLAIVPITFDATPSYLFFPAVAQRVWQVLPDVKIIIMLRHPVDRAYSHYHHQKRHHREERSFDEAMTASKLLFEQHGHHGKHQEIDLFQPGSTYVKSSYVARSIYKPQIERWLSYFPRKQFLFIRSEDFYSNPPQILHHLFNFLHLPPHTISQKVYLQKHLAFGYESVDATTKRKWCRYFEPHNQALYDLLKQDFEWHCDG
ncbi:MAG: sulfotransferase domain-containing protein [Chloroflexi bacterium]|nr:sulfotransferase domain-containing protein [Chloroflexota bacterium]